MVKKSKRKPRAPSTEGAPPSPAAVDDEPPAVPDPHPDDDDEPPLDPIPSPPASPAEEGAVLQRDATVERLTAAAEEAQEYVEDVLDGVADKPVESGEEEKEEEVFEEAVAMKDPVDGPAPLEAVEESPVGCEETVVGEGSMAEGSGRKKRKKRVSFCGENEHDVVTKFVDAPDPWRHADESSMQDVLEAYARMCLSNKVQPLPKVLESIKRNPGRRQRVGVFDLSGENIDLHTVDTLESIFQRMCFEELNLTQCLTDDELAVALMDMLEYYQFADRLVMAGNKKLQFRGWLALAKILKKCCVYYLDLRNNALQDQYTSLITRALRCGSNIVTLHMENCNLSGRGTFLLISALQFSETVQELFLADNRLTPTDMIHVASALKHGWRIKLLDLRNNSIADVGASHLFDSLDDDGNGAHYGLRALVLWNNYLTGNVAKSLASALNRTRSLETLNMGMNDLTDDALFVIKDALMRNRSLRRLGLQSCKISNEGCIALAEYLADHPRFLRLDLRNNEQIRAGGWLALAHATKLCPGLIRLDMSYDVKDAKHMETIREALKMIQMTCINNIEKFEQGSAPQPLDGQPAGPEEPPPHTEAQLVDDVVELEEEQEPPAPILDLEDPAGDFPEFLGNTATSASPSSLDIDVPKKCRPAGGIRRFSITSVMATGPLSVQDRLHEELFPLRPAPPASVFPGGPAVVKGRFQISLVKATEKIYNSMQSVLSPTNEASPTVSKGSPPGGTDPKPGGLLSSWKNTFRRNSKDTMVPAEVPKPERVENVKEEESGRLEDLQMLLPATHAFGDGMMF
ncbi:protein phosphatase 1 regulatory subunit 37-like [Paramacrobiotus metropolitanus]|uniref:protein phosphatase 1 regulatory subunit 37-like n=1 Tax=Paramacrobiotus metropolitanus TaxID=2943436 RepID=UPI002446010C|nr:protein phosphatase 1 regulatory subunit 37-like [Paramacrobiotus metropolitanus]